MHMNPRIGRALAATALLSTGLAIAAAQPASAASVEVMNGDDDGPGSFRDAVDEANGDPSIDTITFADNFDVDLVTAVTFTGSQDLTIEGNGATISGAAAPDTDTWDSGLFVSESGGDLTLSNISFADSFNNGVAVFLPEGNGTVSITLDGVRVDGAQFHGILIDGQFTTGYNSADVIHLACQDPHDVDSNTSIDLAISDTTIEDAGRLAGGYDISLLSGCPQDFDGLRVDQGGNGDITGFISDSSFDGNLADGTELDEKGNGGLDVVVTDSSFDENGLTVGVECTEAYIEQLLGMPIENIAVEDRVCPAADPDDDVALGDLAKDLDDGFDIDEEGSGNLIATISGGTVNANNDEGLDFDEAGNGGVCLTIDGVEAEGNTDEGIKASEEDNGNVAVTLTDVTVTDTDDNDGIQLEEEDNGSIDVAVTDSVITGNDGDGLKVEESDNGSIDVAVTDSVITGNDGDGLKVEESDNGNLVVAVEGSTVNNNDNGIDVEQGDRGNGSLTVTSVSFDDDDINPDPTDPDELADAGIGSIIVTS